MTRLRNRLLTLFLAATLVPLGITLWVANSLLEHYSSTAQLDAVSRSLESTARVLYQRERDALRAKAASGEAEPRIFRQGEDWPPEIADFHASGQPESAGLSPGAGDALILMKRNGGDVLRFEANLGVPLGGIRKTHGEARALVTDAAERDLRRGFLLLAAVPWLASLGVALFAIHRTSSAAMDAYRQMAGELRRSREKLLYVTRLESWQSLARKMAHEVKNSLTPIRLMMEEVSARRPDDAFEQEAARVIVDEVNSLERRVRAFSDFAAEPPVKLQPLDANALVEERIAFLRAAHPDVGYEFTPADRPGTVIADGDLLKAVLTNLLENAAQAAGPGGRVLAATEAAPGKLAIEVHDSGPGLTPRAKASLFEPSISFKKGGMGLGLSIARKSAVLCGGDIESIEGRLGGAAFRVTLSA